MYREQRLSGLEKAAAIMWEQAICAKWLAEGALAEEACNSTVNGIILEDLCKAVQYQDSGSIDMLRHRAPLFALLHKAVHKNR